MFYNHPTPFSQTEHAKMTTSRRSPTSECGGVPSIRASRVFRVEESARNSWKKGGRLKSVHSAAAP